MDALLRKYTGHVQLKARHYFIPGASHEDTIQEGFIGLFKAIRDFRADQDSNFRTFAELCISRNIITAVKGATRQKHIPLNQSVSLDSPMRGEEDGRSLVEIIPYPTESDPEDHFLTQEVARDIRDRLRRNLSEFEAQAFESYLHGRSYQEIADDLGRPLKSVDNALQRIKKKVERNLANVEFR